MEQELKAEENALFAMRHRHREGTFWAAYQNVDMGHRDIGRLQFIMVGAGCTFTDPTDKAPDTVDCGFGWRYDFVGHVDLTTGNVVRWVKCPACEGAAWTTETDTDGRSEVSERVRCARCRGFGRVSP